MTDDAGYVLEDAPDGRSLVVTGPWSPEAAEVLRRGEVDGLVLNYARGFSERGGLELLDGGWGVRRLDVLDRGISDLSPIGRLSDSLEDLSVQAAPGAQLDLGALPRLRSAAGEWALLRDTLSSVDALRSVVTWRFDEVDLHAFRDHVHLHRLTIKEAPYLESLSGVGNLPELTVLGVLLARRLRDISDVAGLAPSLRRFELQSCAAIGAVDDVEPLVNLRFLGVSECGEIESLAPLASLEQLETLYAWGSTRVVDGDLTPLARLPRLKEIRMRNRRGYKPSVTDLVSVLSG
jgi:internalin A